MSKFLNFLALIVIGFLTMLIVAIFVLINEYGNFRLWITIPRAIIEFLLLGLWVKWVRGTLK